MYIHYNPRSHDTISLTPSRPIDAEEVDLQILLSAIDHDSDVELIININGVIDQIENHHDVLDATIGSINMIYEIVSEYEDHEI